MTNYEIFRFTHQPRGTNDKNWLISVFLFRILIEQQQHFPYLHNNILRQISSKYLETSLIILCVSPRSGRFHWIYFWQQTFCWIRPPLHHGVTSQTFSSPELPLMTIREPSRSAACKNTTFSPLSPSSHLLWYVTHSLLFRNTWRGHTAWFCFRQSIKCCVSLTSSSSVLAGWLMSHSKDGAH